MKSTPVDTGLNKGIEMMEDKDLGKVYLMPGFDFKSYNAMFISDCSLNGETQNKDIDPGEMGLYLKNQIIKRLAETGVFTKVTGTKSDLSGWRDQSSKILILECTVTKMDAGSRAMRYLVGFGAGATKVQVENEIRDFQGRELYFKSADRRVAAFGAFGGDSKEFILSSLDQTAEALGSFIKRITSGGKIGGDSKKEGNEL